MGCFSSKAKVAICTGTVTDFNTEVKGVLKITCPKNLPSSRRVKVEHVEHGLLIGYEILQGGGGGGGGDFGGVGGAIYVVKMPLFVTIPGEIQEGQIWEYKAEGREPEDPLAQIDGYGKGVS